MTPADATLVHLLRKHSAYPYSDDPVPLSIRLLLGQGADALEKYARAATPTTPPADLVKAAQALIEHTDTVLGVDAETRRRLEALRAALAAQPVPGVQGTPSAKWRVNGESDPHGTMFDGERASLCGGHMTDDEVANAAYMSPSIANLTAAKERIRWLSRSLEKALASQGWPGVQETLGADLTSDAPDAPLLAEGDPNSIASLVIRLHDQAEELRVGDKWAGLSEDLDLAASLINAWVPHAPVNQPTDTQKQNGNGSDPSASSPAGVPVASFKFDDVVAQSQGGWLTCGPPDQRRQKWLLVYEDADVRQGLYYDEQEARQAWASASAHGYNCHLFGLCHATQPPAPQPLVALSDEPYELDDLDRALIAKVRQAIEYETNGDPAKDVIDEDEMVDAMRLLLQIVDAPFAAASAQHPGEPVGDGWIPWDGGPRPVDGETLVDLQFADGTSSTRSMPARRYFWDEHCDGGTIVAYRIAATSTPTAGELK